MRDSKFKHFLIKGYEKVYHWKPTTAQKMRYALLVRNCKLRIMSPVQTIRYIQKNHCSIARFGDGEFALIRQDCNLNFQTASDDLSLALSEVLHTSDPSLLLCVPGVFNSIWGTKPHAANFWYHWRMNGGKNHPTIALIQKYTKENYLFGDAQITRPYIDWSSPRRAKKIFPMLKQLWNGKDVLIVEGEKSRLGVGNDLFLNAKSIKRILCPAVNAFSYCEDILQAILACYHNELILLALGPTATVLASKLSALGIQALDIGHVDVEYEWFLAGAKQKQQIPGKYVNEVVAGLNPEDCRDKLYLEQITARVGC